MKRYLMTILAVVLTTIGAKAMPYEMAREEAMYLTDKMAYELNLNQRQYEYAYEINLDYLLGLETAEDAYGMLLRYRNEDLAAILYDWQWKLMMGVDYFLRPVIWRYGHWYYPVYAHYARNYYYYSRPAVYHNYRGGHGRSNFERGFYADRRPNWNGGFRGNDRGQVVRDNRAGGMNPGNRMGGMNPGNRMGGMNPGMNMGGMNPGNRMGGMNPGMNMGGPGMNPNINNRGQQPNMNTNRGEANRDQQPNMNTNRGEANRGQQPNMNTNRGTVQRGTTTVPQGGANVSRGTAAGNANRGGSVSVGRGHATGGRGGR